MTDEIEGDQEISWIGQIRFAREYYLRFQTALDRSGVRAPALVFIEPDPADRHRDLVTNSPGLDDPILRVRNRGLNNAELAKEYADRQIWYYNARTERLEGGMSYAELLNFVKEQGLMPE